MTSNLPAIDGIYADLRQVKSRGIWQVLIEVPYEKAERLVDIFGLPRQDEPTWLAIARLKNPPGANGSAAIQASAAPADHPPPPERSAVPGGAKRERTLPEKVGMRCNDENFNRWVGRLVEPEYAEKLGPLKEEWLADWVRSQCGVKSRTEILPGTEAATKWLALETQYLLDTGQMAEERR